MFVLALTRPAPLDDAEVGRLAQDLGSTPYETRMLVSGGVPAILLTAADAARVTAVGDRLRGRGHAVIVLDGALVTASEEMVPVRRPSFGPAGLGADDARPNEVLPYDDVLALVRAVHKSSTRTREKTTELKFNPGRAMALGPMFAMQRTTTEVSKAVEQRENVLYLFRRSGERPWLFSENGAVYTGLGADLAPTRIANFQRVVARLREECRHAQFDDRLLSHKRIPEHLASGPNGRWLETSSSPGVDLVAHVVAAWIASTQSTPYR